MKNLYIRTLSGSIYVLLILSGIYLGKPWFGGLWFIFGIVALYEFYGLKIAKQSKAYIPYIIIGGITYVFALLSLLQILHWYFAVIMVFVAYIWVIISELYRKTENPISNIAVWLMGYLYVLLPVLLMNDFYLHNNTSSLNHGELLFGFFIILWTNDTFAYLTGITFGKHRLFERISPKKSWEGFIGGAVFSALAGYVCFLWLGVFESYHWIIISLIIVVFGTFGDLIESMFKRASNVKDSGNLIPGHGGILDRIDSILLAAPMVYLYVKTIIPNL